jgi:hypothetical protein
MIADIVIALFIFVVLYRLFMIGIVLLSLAAPLAFDLTGSLIKRILAPICFVIQLPIMLGNWIDRRYGHHYTSTSR